MTHQDAATHDPAVGSLDADADTAGESRHLATGSPNGASHDPATGSPKGASPDPATGSPNGASHDAATGSRDAAAGVHDPDVASRRLAHRSLAADDPTGWFEELYSAAVDGRAVVPWDRGMAHPLLADWVSTAQPDGAGRRALVVGAGTGWDAELVADLGFATTAFDISPTAVEAAQHAHPGSKAHYQVADLLNPPSDWHRSFDLVIEIFTVQALPIALQPAATRQVSEQVRAGGTLIVIAAARDDEVPDDEVDGPPWPLTRASIDAFAGAGLRLIQLERAPSPSDPTSYRWRAEFLRD